MAIAWYDCILMTLLLLNYFQAMAWILAAVL
jgi:hypothetical protein